MEKLDLIVKKQWYDLSTAGIKTEEFRRDCLHWRQRFMTEEKDRHFRVNTRGTPTPDKIRDFGNVILRKGYTRTMATFKCLGIRWQQEGIQRVYRISDDKPEIELEMPGALFIISLGERIE